MRNDERSGRGRQFLCSYIADRSGAAAAEFALVLTLLSIPLLNVVDLGMYVYQYMELQDATQVGAQAAWAIVPSCTLPLTLGSNCTNLTSAITTALQSTSLGASATVSSVSEAYYCINSRTGQLQVVGTLSSEPANCGSIGSSSETPSDYVIVSATYTYTPIFSAVSVVNLLATPITGTVWMRVA